MKVILIVLLSLCVYTLAQFNCDDVQCNPCASSGRIVDFAFLLDCSGSMGYEISLVRTGLSAFVTQLKSNEIDSRFAIVLYGTTCELVMDWEVDLQPTLDTFSKIESNTAVDGFQLRHYRQEACFECMTMMLGEAPYSDLDRTYTGGPVNYPGLAWRKFALKFFFMVTDEDCDAPYYDPNKFPGQDNTDNREPPADIKPEDGWGQDRLRAATAMIKHRASISIMFNLLDVPAEAQIGNYNADVSDPNFLNFDAAATLKNLENIGLLDSFQTLLLKKGLYCRTFNILEIESPDFIANFFTAAVEATTLCEGEASCFQSTCDPQKGCIDEPICSRIINDVNECSANCMIDGVCYGLIDSNPKNACEVCVNHENRWGACDDGDKCTREICDPALGCKYEKICTEICDRCSIDGGCYEAYEVNPNNNCEYCDPRMDTEWSVIDWNAQCNKDLVVEPSNEDRDGDGFTNNLDFCPDLYFPNENKDTDGDGMGDPCDPCPNQPGNIAQCGDPTCSDHGTCNCGNGNNMVCECEPDYYGAHCENKLSCKKFDDCNGHGKCEVANNGVDTICVCESGYDGEKCEPAVCNGCVFGTCVSNFNCECFNGYSDEACSTPPDNVCISDADCNNNGKCGAKAKGSCECDEGFSGQFCDVGGSGAPEPTLDDSSAKSLFLASLFLVLIVGLLSL